MIKHLLFLIAFVLSSEYLVSQHLEVLEGHESFQATYNQLLRIPIRVKNNTDKPQFYVIRKVKGEIGDTQKGYFCLSNNCLESSIEEFSKKIEPGETLQDLYYTFESGLQQAQTTIKFEYFPKGNTHEIQTKSVSILVEEKPNKTFVFQSKEITIHDIYPNPVQDQAFIDYKLHSDFVKAKISIHNVLGKTIADYDLPFSETRLKLSADDLLPGVYFYTVYLNNSGILTRKMMVRK